MGRSKEQFIAATGGFRMDESFTGTLMHSKAIQALEDEIRSGKLSFDEVEQARQKLITLKGLPSDEWDYDPND